MIKLANNLINLVLKQAQLAPVRPGINAAAAPTPARELGATANTMMGWAAEANRQSQTPAPPAPRMPAPSGPPGMPAARPVAPIAPAARPVAPIAPAARPVAPAARPVAPAAKAAPLSRDRQKYVDKYQQSDIAALKNPGDAAAVLKQQQDSYARAQNVGLSSSGRNSNGYTGIVGGDAGVNRPQEPDRGSERAIKEQHRRQFTRG